MSKSLAYLAFEALHNKLNLGNPVSLKEFNTYTGTTENQYPSKAPLFVTWHKNHRLRGCIGTFLSSQTESGVSSYALVSAFEDPRFPPISKSELPLLTVDVTLLDHFRPIELPTDWEVGTHGLKVQLTQGGHSYLGTFLPSVAEEQEWDTTDTLFNLLRKADYSGISRAKTLEFYKKGIEEGWLELIKYEGLKCGSNYAEFLKAHTALAKD